MILFISSDCLLETPHVTLIIILYNVTGLLSMIVLSFPMPTASHYIFQDVIWNDNITLDDMFKFSISLDIAKVFIVLVMIYMPSIKLTISLCDLLLSFFNLTW